MISVIIKRHNRGKLEYKKNKYNYAYGNIDTWNSRLYTSERGNDECRVANK